MLALAQHDLDLCPSGAGPEHYRDECDADTTDIEPKSVERSCVYLAAREEWEDARAQDKAAEKGVLVGFIDGADPATT